VGRARFCWLPGVVVSLGLVCATSALADPTVYSSVQAGTLTPVSAGGAVRNSASTAPVAQPVRGVRPIPHSVSSLVAPLVAPQAAAGVLASATSNRDETFTLTPVSLASRPYRANATQTAGGRRRCA
jgi:hypothetical protein